MDRSSARDANRPTTIATYGRDLTQVMILFSRGHATLELAVSVGRSVGRSDFKFSIGFRIAAPAQPSATGLPCIRPC